LGNSAVEGEDYPAFAQTVTWQAGDDQPKTITIPYFDDTEAEPIEFFLLVLSNVQGDAVLDRQTQFDPGLSWGLALAFDYSDTDLVLDTDSWMASSMLQIEMMITMVSETLLMLSHSTPVNN